MKFSIRKWILIGFAVLVLGGIVYGFLPKPKEVDLAKAVRGNMSVTVDQEGKTRVQKRYIVYAPLSGRLLRVKWDPGDEVEIGQTIASVEPTDPSLLDDRARQEAKWRVERAKAAIQQADKQLKKAETMHKLAESKLERARLAVTGISQDELDKLIHEEMATEHDMHAAKFALKIAEYEHKLAQAALLRVSRESPGEKEEWTFAIPSPITGKVLKVIQESAKVVQPGSEILEIGNLRHLEAEVDVLSTDAVKIKENDRVEMEYGGPEPLKGFVRLVEPHGFMKVSALGVEEQRVYVIVKIENPPPNLGDGYRVEASIFIWEGEVLKIPAGALFRQGDEWAVFVVREGVARLKTVEVGHNNGLEAEIREGLNEGDQVIVHPSDEISDGVSVVGR